MKTTSTKINDLMKDYKELNDSLKRLEKTKNDIKSEIKTIMDKKGVNALHGFEFIATLSPQQRKSLDTIKVKELLGSKYDQFLKMTDYQVFKVVEA